MKRRKRGRMESWKGIRKERQTRPKIAKKARWKRHIHVNISYKWQHTVSYYKRTVANMIMFPLPPVMVNEA